MTTENENVEATNEAERFDWIESFKEKDKGEKKEQKKAVWMKFDHPGDYTVRLVGPGVEFLQYNWIPFGKGTRVITHDNYKGQDPAMLAGFYAAPTCAIHVIDRADGELKILAKSKTFFKAFSEYRRLNNINPAGKEGTDWTIKVVWPKGDKKQAEYTATALAKPTPFNEKEVEMIRAGISPLSVIYKATPLAKIQELWNALPADSKVPPVRESKYPKKDGKPAVTATTKPVEKATPKIVEPVEPAEEEVSVGDDSDLFGDGDEKTDAPF